MNTYEELIYKLNDAYGVTTHSVNHFANLINSISWDNVFTADGETYYKLGDLTLMVENLNPFEEAWKPSIILGTFFRELGWI